MRLVGGTESQYTQVPYLWAAHKQETNYNCRGSPQGVSSLNPTLCSPAPDDDSPKHLGLKASGAYFQEFWRAVGNRDPENVTCSRTQSRSCDLKGSWVRPTCWSWRVSWRGRSKMELMLGTQTLATAIFESSFYHMDPGAGKHHFGILPLVY